MVWRDSKPVYFLSSIHDASIGAEIKRNSKNKDGVYEKVGISCPQLAIDYNKNMVGVDKNHQSL